MNQVLSFIKPLFNNLMGDMSKIQRSNDLFVIYAVEGEAPLSNFTFLCTVLMEKRVIF